MKETLIFLGILLAVIFLLKPQDQQPMENYGPALPPDYVPPIVKQDKGQVTPEGVSPYEAFNSEDLLLQKQLLAEQSATFYPNQGPQQPTAQAPGFFDKILNNLYPTQSLSQ